MRDLLDFTSGPPLPVPVETLAALDERSRSQGAKMIVVGAVARDLVVHAPTASIPHRVTLDVDIAVAVDRDGFKTFTDGLERVKGNGHKFLIDGVEVDVVPYGPIETDRSVLLNDGHRLDVNGISEAAVTAVRVLLPGGFAVDVASLPAQAALKVLAWRDRRFDNPKDGLDLRQILDAAAQGPYGEEVWADDEALEHGEYDLYQAAAYRVGRQAAKPFTAEDGAHVLDVVSDDALASSLARHMRSGSGLDLVRSFAAGFRAGLTRGQA